MHTGATLVVSGDGRYYSKDAIQVNHIYVCFYSSQFRWDSLLVGFDWSHGILKYMYNFLLFLLSYLLVANGMVVL